MADNVFAQFARVMLTPLGDDNAARIAGATNLLAHQAAGTGVDAQTAFEQGRKEFKQDLRQTRLEHPFGAFGAEMAGTAALAGLGGTAAKALRLGALLNALEKPFVRGSAYPKRSRQQWQKDLQYGKEQFNALRARGPLKREGHPDARINSKVSWGKIRKGNLPEKYDMLRDVPDIYATGEYHMQPRLKKRKDDFEKFHWFQKDNRGIQVAEDETGRVLYNVNPNVAKYLVEHPEVAKKLGVQIPK